MLTLVVFGGCRVLWIVLRWSFWKKCTLPVLKVVFAALLFCAWRVPDPVATGQTILELLYSIYSSKMLRRLFIVFICASIAFNRSAIFNASRLAMRLVFEVVLVSVEVTLF